MKYAQILNGVAVSVITVPAGFALSDCIHGSMIAQVEQVPDNVTPGSTRANDGTWTIANAPVPESPTPVYADIPPAQFYLCFTVAEAVAIKAYAANTANPMAADVGEFLTRLQMWIDQGQPVVPSSTAVTNGLAGLVALGLLDQARVPAILAGEQQ